MSISPLSSRHTLAYSMNTVTFVCVSSVCHLCLCVIRVSFVSLVICVCRLCSLQINVTPRLSNKPVYLRQSSDMAVSQNWNIVTLCQ